MSVSVKLPAEFQEVYQNIFKQNSEEGTIHLIINELRRRLAEYKLMDKMFREIYKMDFDEFKGKRIVEEFDHSFQVEEDYCAWELAIDGIKTISFQFQKLAKYT